MVNLTGEYPKVTITETGIIFASFHTPEHVLCNKVGNWAEHQNTYFGTSNPKTLANSTVLWKPTSEPEQFGPGQKVGMAITKNNDPTTNARAPYLIAMTHQGAGEEKRVLHYRLGYYTE